MVEPDIAFAKRQKKVASEKLQRFGEPYGSIKVIRETKGAIDPENPSAGPQVVLTEYPCSGYFTTYELEGGVYVQRGNAFMIIDVDSLDIEPSTDDRATFLGRTYNIEQIDETRAAGITVLYTLKVKA